MDFELNAVTHSGAALYAEAIRFLLASAETSHLTECPEKEVTGFRQSC